MNYVSLLEIIDLKKIR